jgi:hypothetical protein
MSRRPVGPARCVVAAALAAASFAASMPAQAIGAPASAPAAGASAAAPAPAAASFSEESTRTGALTFNIGDRFIGPGVLTIGWLGSKKQVVLPSGDWIVLAAADHDGGGATKAQMVSVVFGQFDGDRLATSLRVTANRRGASAVTRWTDVEACRAPKLGTRLHRWASPSGDTVEACVEVLRPGHMAIDQAGSVAEEWGESLNRLGAHAVGATLTSRLYFTDRADGYLRVIRTDWNPVLIAMVEPTPLVAWLTAYERVAAIGFHKSVPRDDLVPARSADARRVPADALDPTALKPLERP